MATPDDLTTATASAAQHPAPAEGFPASPPGYELRDEIGRGGMGAVYRALDVALGRDVAVKLLSARYAPDSPAARRFLGEARITGQLQHPGIPAVHQVGTLPDGRPFLAMKLIKGKTLEAILGDRADPSADRGRLLGVFEAVCQAVAYAHAHRVIHRDLKPSNVMVGAFAEVQVMDWGLAKVLGDPEPAAAGAPRPEETRAWTEVSPTPEDGSHTQAGSLVGTPAFIPPEQAVGEIDRVNERADVFGLGALLAVILTGKPPYVGATAEAVRVQAVRGQLDDCFARLDASGAEPGLVALCRRCLAFEPGDRPRDAGEVAQAVAGLRAAAEERAQAAERERLAAEVRAAEQTKRRQAFQRAAAAFVAVLGLGVAGTTAGLIQADHQRRLAEQAQADESRQRQAALREREEAELARARAVTEAGRANREAATADQVSGFLVGLFAPDDRGAVAAANLGFRAPAKDGLSARDLLARSVRRLNAAELKGQPLVRARLLHEVGGIYFSLGDAGAAAPLLDEALRLRRRELPAGHPDLVPGLQALALVRFAGEDLSALDLFREAIAILKAQPDPDTLPLAEAEVGLAVAVWELLSRPGEAGPLLEHAHRIYRKHRGEHDLQTLTTLMLLVLMDAERGDLVRALPRVADLTRGLGQSKADPELVAFLRLVTTAMTTRYGPGGITAAIPAWRTAIEQGRKVLGPHHYLSVLCYRSVAGALYAAPRGPADLKEAAALYRDALAAIRSWGVPRPRLEGTTCLDLGRTLMRLGNHKEAEAELRKAIALLRPLRPEFQASLPHALQMLGWTIQRLRDPKKQTEVGGLLEEAVNVSRANPNIPAGRRAYALGDLGRWRLLQGDGRGAAPLLAEAADLWHKEHRKPDTLVRAEALAFLGAALKLEGRTTEAAAAHAEANEILLGYPKDTTDLPPRIRAVLAGKMLPWP